MRIDSQEFFKKIENAFVDKKPFVVYHFPENKTVKSFFQSDDSINLTSDFKKSGFIFAPFDDRKEAYLLPMEISEHLEIPLAEVPLQRTDNKINFKHAPPSDKVRFENLVIKALKFLKESDCKKVVLSRKETFNYPNFEPINTFLNLLRLYENAMVYMWYHPGVGLWLGATPETLLKADHGEFTTVALAGTQAFHGSLDVVWLQKEKQEQQLVTDYLLEKFEGTSSLTFVSEPQTIKAGSIVHLCTTIRGKLSEKVNISTLLKELHPTPAVCGVPKDLAKKFIMSNEGYDRAFYTGFLGELNLHDSTNIFVNLRCMEIEDNMVNLYVGGGITSDSVAQQEWEETVAKSNIMKAVLGMEN